MIWGVASLQGAGLLTQSVVLAATTLVSVVVAAGVSDLVLGRNGLLAASAAGVACFAGAETGLVVGRLLRGVKPQFAGFLAGMLPRMGIPLMCGILLHVRNHPVAEAGFLLYLLVLYPLLLAVETAMSLPRPPDRSSGLHNSATARGSDRLTHHDA